jgi:hypothetical protein
MGAIAVLTVILLRAEGRIWWCACGKPWPWISDVWTSHCSQHLADPYTFSHLNHGLIFFLVFAAVARKVPMGWRLCMAVAIAAAWEVAENSAYVINRYRTATMSLDYLGDSVINSMGDIGACFLGFLLARRIGLWWTLGVIVAVEVVMLAMIRDNLTLNVLMLVWPIKAIKAWQTAGHGAAFIAGAV